ncbi:MAG: LysM peptidoglycan-binding domain-containing protein [Solirubrobacteraceae bacterium]
MRRLIVIPFLAISLAGAALPSGAAAAVGHTVVEGETLWSIAAASNLTTRTVAAFNGLSEDSQVVLGQTIMVPSVDEGAAALATVPATTATTAASAPGPMGGYTVRLGDTLSGLAAAAGVPAEAMAAMNGLDPAGILVAGTVIKLPTGAPAMPQASEPAPAAVVPAADPVPTETTLDAGTVSAVATEHGVSGSLAAAIAWQESGFNNAMVSSANARGVMQVMPGTWTWIQDNLATTALNPASATDNVAAGSLYMKHLLEQTGGDEATAIASYYQGLSSVQNDGMLPETEQYVANVQALRGRFGG